MRFSLKVLLVAFTGVAISIAGLIYANLPWAASFYTAAFVLVLTGIVGALVRPWPQRGFWIGFALFGAGYFWLALVAEESRRIDRFGAGIDQEPALATTHLLLASEPYLRGEHSPRGVRSVRRGPTEYYIQVGHSIFTFLFALAGGMFGQWLTRRGPPKTVP